MGIEDKNLIDNDDFCSIILRKPRQYKDILMINPKANYETVRRTLHVLALLQNIDDPMNVNATNFSEYMTEEALHLYPNNDDIDVDQKSITRMADSHLIEEYKLNIEKPQGSRKWKLAEPLSRQLSPDEIKWIAHLYLNYVVHDSARDMVIDVMMKEQPDIFLWVLARLYFASIMKQKVIVEYLKSGSDEPKEYTIHPYHLVFRENELYIILLDENRGIVKHFAVYRIKNLKIKDDSFQEKGPSAEEYFKDVFGAYTGEQTYEVKLKVKDDIVETVANVLSNLNLKIEKQNDGSSLFTFKNRDPRSLCKQLFFYGKKVEILGSNEVRKIMKEMINDVSGIY